MTILLLGKTGQVGWELNRALAPLGSLVAVGREVADFDRPEELVRFVRQQRPALIVNAVAYTAVDKAEQEPGAAQRVNSDAVAMLAEAACELDSWLIHYSTDYVFDGTKQGAYVEDDATNPISVYGQTKRSGELAIAASGCRHLIFRTSWVHAPRGHNFIRTVMRLARERDELRMVADQTGAPTGASLIADTTALAIQGIIGDRPSNVAPGTYHLTAAGETSWHELARLVVSEALSLGAELKTRPEAIVPIATSDYPVPAPRPANSRLDTTKLRTALGVDFPDWKIDVRRAVSELLRRDAE
jgi:dTDP-4-dehydrorhamnose reductase